MLKHLPNALTLLRLILAPVVAWMVWQSYAEPTGPWAIIAALSFIAAALTDFFDGMAARMLKADSKFGRLIDPIADKALVGLPLIAISAAGLEGHWPLAAIIAIATGIIVLRDLVITIKRFTAKDGEGAKVSELAKWKTALELIAVGLPIVFLAAAIEITASPALTYIWLGLLVLAAALSVITAIQYFTKKPAAA
jgi:CDP-diacylglycerol--glycerol-3-phosphate 3-phosphatidyltransferase